MQSLFEILWQITNIIWFIMVAHIIMSWLISFQVLNPYQPMVSQIWNGLSRLLDPVYAPIRRILPNTGPLDLAPLVAFVVLTAIQTILRNNIGHFM